MDGLPSVGELLVIAPIVTLTTLLIVIGFYGGRYASRDHIETLKAWIESLGKK